MVGAFLGAHLDPHEARCHALVAEGVWEEVLANKTYAFLLPAEGGVVQHNEDATEDHPCHESFKVKYTSVTERRRLAGRHSRRWLKGSYPHSHAD